MTLYATIATKHAGRLMPDSAVIVAGSLLLWLSGKVYVPFYPVPMTLQTLAVVGLGLALGPRRAVAAVVTYLLAGFLGLPVFAGGLLEGGGIQHLFGPTGGYLVGFIPAAWLAGWFAERGWDRRPGPAIAAAFLANIAVYALGLTWLGRVIGFDRPVLELGFYPFVWGDLTKAVLAGIGFPAAWRWLGSSADA